jgi:transcriptional regulator with XRE-family HTH domain
MALKSIKSGKALGDTLVQAAERLGGLGARARRTPASAIAVGDEIRRERLARGLTQTQLAALSNMAQADISTIERGGGPDGPSLRLVGQIAEALDTTFPIGPVAARWKKSVLIEGAEICESYLRFRDIVPLIPTDGIKAMKNHLRTLFIADKGVVGAPSLTNCTLVRIGHHGTQKATVHSNAEPVFIATVGGRPKYGKGTLKIQRYAKCRYLAAHETISVEAAQDDDVSLVIFPASALMQGSRETAS